MGQNKDNLRRRNASVRERNIKNINLPDEPFEESVSAPKSILKLSKTPDQPIRRFQIAHSKNYEKDFKKAKRHWAGKQCHRPNISLISRESGWDDYRGFLNLCILLLILSNARTFLENLIVFGLRVDPIQWIGLFWQLNTMPNLILAINATGFAFLAVLIEKAIVAKKLRTKWHVISITVLFLYATGQVLLLQFSPATSIPALGWALVVMLKLWSYAQTNYWYRIETIERPSKLKRSRSASENMSITSLTSEYAPEAFKYPNNVSMTNMIQFMVSPTLCYEIDFPRTERIRVKYLIRRLIEMVLLFQIELSLVQQWIVPILETSLSTVEDKDSANILERLLRLAIPNHIIWLTFFYLFFHSSLNFFAEITRFADREFYRDWWNAKDITEFWSLWNIPVHKWCVRHLYKPLLRSGLSKLTANLIVFAFSAILHEYLVSVPMKMLRFYAFSGMIMQVPLAFISSAVCRILGRNYGNMVVWLSLICGQPIACLMYVYDYYSATNSLDYFRQFR